MLEIRRANRGLSVEATCHSCGDPIINPGAASIGYQAVGRIQPVLMHVNCGNVWVKAKGRGQHRRIMPASQLFKQLT